MNHDTWVVLAKSGGLFYLIALSIGVLFYALWPSKQRDFDRAARSILDEDAEERPLSEEER